MSRLSAIHPVAVAALVTALLALVAMDVNDGFYDFLVNYDPQGDEQVREESRTRWVFRYTSGVLCGQFIALVAGVVLARGRRQVTALVAAVSLGVLLAGVTAAVAIPVARVFPDAPVPVDPVPVRLLVSQLGAYPLWAAAGVGLGVLLRGARRGSGVLLVLAAVWWVAALTGLLQDDVFALPEWLLWTVPPMAAGTAIALAGLSMDVWSSPAVLEGDWGRTAGVALLVGAAAYALVLNLLGALIGRRRAAR
jgi:hypothetical protein